MPKQRPKNQVQNDWDGKETVIHDLRRLARALQKHPPPQLSISDLQSLWQRNRSSVERFRKKHSPETVTPPDEHRRKWNDLTKRGDAFAGEPVEHDAPAAYTKKQLVRFGTSVMTLPKVLRQILHLHCIAPIVGK